jgi:5-(carboxyamino)imidazole ribonucleotide synthase
MNVTTLGILGGGQLGRMTALAARPLGLSVRVLDPDPHCAARPVVEHVEVGAFDDARAAERLARACDVVTLEIEKIAPKALAAVEAHAPLRPPATAIEIVQDRVRQKAWLVRRGFPVGPFETAEDEAQFVRAVTALDGQVFAKSAFGGYDGRGQARLAKPSKEPLEARAKQAWTEMGAGPCVVEQALELAEELSVMVARDPRGASVAYPAARNHHEQGILRWSVLPGGFPAALEQEAQRIALALAQELELTGLLCVELFHTADGRLYVNELAPRPHNSYHASIEGSATSQFEQLVRATCGWPLGSTEVVRPAAIVNLLGDLWAERRAPAFERALERSGVRLHLYGKGDPRPGRKMGHLSATAATPEGARTRVLEAYAAL